MPKCTFYIFCEYFRNVTLLNNLCVKDIIYWHVFWTDCQKIGAITIHIVTQLVYTRCTYNFEGSIESKFSHLWYKVVTILLTCHYSQIIIIPGL